jgi:hypothetical protein
VQQTNAATALDVATSSSMFMPWGYVLVCVACAPACSSSNICSMRTPEGPCMPVVGLLMSAEGCSRQHVLFCTHLVAAHATHAPTWQLTTLLAALLCCLTMCCWPCLPHPSNMPLPTVLPPAVGVAGLEASSCSSQQQRIAKGLVNSGLQQRGKLNMADKGRKEQPSPVVDNSV